MAPASVEEILGGGRRGGRVVGLGRRGVDLTAERTADENILK